MVPVEKENAYALREFLQEKAHLAAGADPFKSCWLSFLGFGPTQQQLLPQATLSLYQKCAISGLGLLSEPVSKQDVARLLGQAPRIDSTPMSWVSDPFGVMSVKWMVAQIDDDQLNRKFKTWAEGFLPQQIASNRFSTHEHDIAAYIRDGDAAIFGSASIPLFLHYRGVLRIDDHKTKLLLIERFMNEFRGLSRLESSAVLLGLMVYVFDRISQDVVLVPPNGWALSDLLRFLEKIPVGLKRWTWEDVSRTKGAEPVKWPVENEYHVQNLLYVLLGPIFNDISDEVWLEPVGQKTPRVDLYLPSLHTIIEVKFRKDTRKSFQALISEVAEDASLYRSDPKYKDAKIVTFLWDHTRSTQEHTKFREGVMKIPGMDGCVVVCSPSSMG